MWSPTHVSIIIRKAKNLLTKGKNDTNNAFVVIELGKESYRTSIKEKVDSKLIVWQEECEFKIPKSDNALVSITALHRNVYGLDQFLGTVQVPLSSFDKNGNSTRWYIFQGKPGKERGRDKLRGEVEVTVQFTSKPSASLVDLQKKKSRSFASLFNIPGNGKVLSFKDITQKAFRKKRTNEIERKPSKNLDPGVLTDGDEEETDTGSVNTSLTSRNSQQSGGETPLKLPRIFASQTSLEAVTKPPLQRKLSNSCLDLRELDKHSQDDRKCISSVNLQDEDQANIFSKFSKKIKQFQSSEKRDLNRLVVPDFLDKQKPQKSILSQFNNKSREELISMIIELQKKVNSFHVHVLDLEDYLDRLLVKVMENSPKLLER